MTPKVCISVLNWNNADQTIACLQTLSTLDYPNYDVVVVDNASADDSVEQIQHAFPEVTLLGTECNTGYAGGNEAALNHALADGETELFWILNSDAIVQPDTLTALVDAYRQYGEGLYGSVILTEESLQEEWILKIGFWPITRNRRYTVTKLHGLPFRDHFPTTDVRRVASLHGSSLMIALSAVRKHGFMDTNFFLYSEESDYCLRMGKHGIPCYLAPASIVYHRGGGSHRPSMEPIIKYYQTRNRLILERRHFFYPDYLRTLAAYVTTALKGMLRGDRKTARYQLLGIRHALIGRMGKTFAPEDYL